MIMPFGTYTTPKRLTGLAEVAAKAEKAGTMLSSSGSANVAPIPRKTVRRGIAFLKTIIFEASSFRLRGARLGQAHGLLARAPHDAHAKGRAVDDTKYDSRPAVIVLCRIARDFSDRGQIRV